MDDGVSGTKRRFGCESTKGGASELLLYLDVSFFVRRQLRVLVQDDAEGETSLILCVAGLLVFVLVLVFRRDTGEDGGGEEVSHNIGTAGMDPSPTETDRWSDPQEDRGVNGTSDSSPFMVGICTPTR